MPLTKSDRDFIKLTIETAIQRAIAPISKDVQTLNQTVYGVDKENGLRSAVKGQGEKIEELDTFKTKAMVYVSIISTTAATLVALGIKYFFK